MSFETSSGDTLDLKARAVTVRAFLLGPLKNPLTNIRTLEKAEWVMVRGRIVP